MHGFLRGARAAASKRVLLSIHERVYQVPAVARPRQYRLCQLIVRDLTLRDFNVPRRDRLESVKHLTSGGRLQYLQQGAQGQDLLFKAVTE